MNAQGGNTLRVTLPENRTAGYRWRAVSTCPGLLRMTGDEYIPPAPGAPLGEAGMRVFSFSALSEDGRGRLLFEYARDFGGGKAARRLCYSVTVTGGAVSIFKD